MGQVKSYFMNKMKERCKYFCTGTLEIHVTITFRRWWVKFIKKNMKEGEEEEFDCIVIGAGWAGVGLASSLKTNGVSNFKVLEKGDRVGYFWHKL